MAKQDILGFLSSNESSGEEDTAMLDPAARELTGSDSDVEGVVEKISASTKAIGKVIQDDAESEDEGSSSGCGEEEERAEPFKEPSNKLDNTEVVETTEVENTKRKRGGEDEDSSRSTDDESGEGDARAALLDEGESPSPGPSLKKRKSTTEKSIPGVTPPPTPKKYRAKKDVKGCERRGEATDVEDTGTNDGGGASTGRPQPKPKRGGKKKGAHTTLAKASSPSPAKPRGRPKKSTKKDPKVQNGGDEPPQGQGKSAEGGGITAGEIGVIFEILTAGADWAAIVAETNALIGLKRLGQNVSKHWKTIAKKRLLDSYGA